MPAQRNIELTLLKNDLLLVQLQARKLGLELVGSLVAMAIMSIENHPPPANDDAKCVNL